MAIAADWFVNNKNGDDTGAGTSGDPFKTLAHALTVVSAGETIAQALDGSACETLTSALAPTVTGVLPGGYIRLIGTNSSFDDDGTNYVVCGDGQVRCLEIGSNISYYYVKNVIFQNSNQDGIKTYQTTVRDWLFDNCIFQGHAQDGVDMNQAVNAWFYKCIFRNNGQNGGSGRNCRYIDCVSHGNGGLGFYFSGAPGFVVNCISYDNSVSQYNLGVSGSVIANCVADGTGTEKGVENDVAVNFVYKTRITNCLSGFEYTTQDTWEDWNAIIDNTTAYDGTGPRELSDNSVTTGTAGYVDRDNANYMLTTDATLRQGAAAFPDGINTEYSAAGLTAQEPVAPSEDDVRDGVTYGVDSGSEGNLELPTEAQVEDGIGFGSNGTEFTGSATLASFTLIAVAPTTDVYAGDTAWAVGFEFDSSGNTLHMINGSTTVELSIVSENSSVIQFLVPDGYSNTGAWDVRVTKSDASTSTLSNALNFADASTGVPARTNLRAAFIRGLLQITTGRGYFLTIEKAYDPPINEEKMKRYPAANVYWETERMDFTRFGAQNALYDLTLPVTVDVFLRVTNYDDIPDVQDKALASIQKYFGNNFYIPDSNGQRTAFEVIYRSSVPFGTETDKPNCGVRVGLDVRYRIRVKDPEIMN